MTIVSLSNKEWHEVIENLLLTKIDTEILTAIQRQADIYIKRDD